MLSSILPPPRALDEPADADRTRVFPRSRRLILPSCVPLVAAFMYDVIKLSI
jgi:hypothetical protein